MSDEQQTAETPKKKQGWPKGVARKPIIARQREDAEKNRQTVLARRLGGNPFGQSTPTIPLKEQGWYTRWDNTLANPQQFYENVHVNGYLPVHKDDLAVSVDQLGVQTTPEGYVCRGSGSMLEILYKMPVEDRKAIKAAQTEENNRRIGKGSQSGTREAIANAAGASLGSEAGDYLHKLPGKVVDSLITHEES